MQFCFSFQPRRGHPAWDLLGIGYADTRGERKYLGIGYADTRGELKNLGIGYADTRGERKYRGESFTVERETVSQRALPGGEFRRTKLVVGVVAARQRGQFRLNDAQEADP